MYIQRNLYEKIKPFLKTKEAIVITGMRRVGKTVLLKHFFEKTDTDNKIFLDLENPADQLRLEKTDYDVIPRNLGLDISRPAFIFIDEIQELKSTLSVVKYLSDHYDIKFFLTGSASFYIHNLFSESLAGRKHIFELFPFDFKEFLRTKNEKLSLPEKLPISQFQFIHFRDLFDEYVEYGGFPQVVLAKTISEKQAQLKDIFSSYWLLEVEKLSDFRKKDKIRDFIFLLLERIGSRIDINKFSKELGIARHTVMDYLAFLQDTYLFSAIPPYSTNRDVEIRAAKKLYAIDSGLLGQFARLNPGSVFENAVFGLLRQRGEVRYWQQKNGQEIDFVLDGKSAYEVKLSAQESDLKILRRRSASIGLTDCQVISRDYSDNPEITYGFLL